MNNNEHEDVNVYKEDQWAAVTCLQMNVCMTTRWTATLGSPDGVNVDIFCTDSPLQRHVEPQHGVNAVSEHSPNKWPFYEGAHFHASHRKSALMNLCYATPSLQDGVLVPTRDA